VRPDGGFDDPRRSGGRRDGSPPAAGEADEEVPGGGDRASERSQGRVYHCDLCGHAMLDLHCKLICQRCGYKRDCSDP
jgi:hypothetical protein